MRRLAIGVLAGATAWGAGPMGVPSAAVGDRIQSVHRTELALTLDVQTEAGHRRVPLGKTHSQRSIIDVLGVSPERLRLTWLENHQTDHGPDGNRSFDLPVSDLTYEVRASDGHVAATGRAASPAERDINLQAADVFTLQAGLRAMLGTAPAEVGYRVPAGSMFAGLMRDAPGTPTVDGWLTLRSVGPRDGVACAEYDLALSLSSSGELEPGVWADVTAALAGTVLVEVETGWTRRLSVSGPVRLEGRGVRHGRAFTMLGTGTFSSETAVVRERVERGL